jgi:hypothetical protein
MTLEELCTYQIGGFIGDTPHPCLYLEWTGENSQAVKKAWITTDEQIKAVEEQPNFRKWMSREELGELQREMWRARLGVSKESWEEAKKKARTG